MRKIFIFLSGVLLFSCTQTITEVKYDGGVNALLPTEVIIKYEHNLQIPQETDIFVSIDKNSFYTTFLEKALYGTYKIYDASDTTISINTQSVKEIIENTTKHGVKIEKDFQRILFRERWFFNKETFEFKKEVVGFAPIRIYFNPEDTQKSEEQKELMFWLIQNNQKQKEWSSLKLLKENVTYEFNLFNNANPVWMSDLNVQRLVSILLENVINNKLQAYDFFDETKKLNATQIKENMGASLDYMYAENEQGEQDTIEVVSRMQPEEITMMIFIEDWYTDEATGMIYKKVKKIAPVRSYFKYYENGDEEHVKKIPFMVKLP